MAKRHRCLGRLRAFLASGLTSAFAIGVATGISEKEMALLLIERIEPTKEQEEHLEKLLKNYKLAAKLVDMEMAKGRLG